MSSSAAALILARQYRDLTNPKKAVPGFHIELENDNIFLWNIGVMVLDEDLVYYGGYFKAQMKFPLDFPYLPPTFRFTPAIYHPNVYRDGRLCILILHASGDPHLDEPDLETWLPVQSVETVLILIVLLLEDPNILLPANVDAAVEWRKNRDKYAARVRQEVERSKQDIPEGFVMPTAKDAYGYPLRNEDTQPEDGVDPGFWNDLEDEDSVMDVEFEDDIEMEEESQEEDK